MESIDFQENKRDRVVYYRHLAEHGDVELQEYAREQLASIYGEWLQAISLMRSLGYTDER